MSGMTADEPIARLVEWRKWFDTLDRWLTKVAAEAEDETTRRMAQKAIGREIQDDLDAVVAEVERLRAENAALRERGWLVGEGS